MEYGLKYSAEFRNTRAHDYRLEVYRRDYDGIAKTMGDLCGCVLEVQGGMDDIIAPIVKTQLRFSLVDTSDKADTGTTKFGDWQEFFTPDATLYKVVLSELNGSTATALWAGYITPDSWHEDLDYRGIVTITARDNIGHLKDFPFVADGYIAPDENGLIEIRWILARAMQVIDFPMEYSIEAAGSGQYSADVPVTDDGDYLTEARVNAALFEGMDWYAALEQTLEAIGFAFRFVGGNKCVFGCLRNLPKVGHYSSAVGTQEVEFYGGALELDPAVKRIEEEQDYKVQKEVALGVFDGLEFASSVSTYRCKTDGNPLPSGGGTVSVPEHNADYRALTASGRTGWQVGAGMLDPDAETADDFLVREEGVDGWRKYAFIACNQQPGAGGTSIYADYQFKSRSAGMKLTFRFTPNALSKRTSGSMAGKMAKFKYSLDSIKYYVMFTDGTTTRYWDGARWQSSAFLLTATYDSTAGEATDLVIETNECPDIADSGTMLVRLGQIIYKMFYDGGYGCYARVAYIGAAVGAQTILQSNKVTTINNADYNVLMTRKPLFGALSRKMGFVVPANYLAGLFYYPFAGGDPELFPYEVRFTDYVGGTVPLPVLIHEQILCYYHGAARVLSGSCAAINKARTAFDKLFTYKGHSYLLQGGTMDFFSGIISGAILREYIDFNDLWTSAPTYDEEVKYND